MRLYCRLGARAVSPFDYPSNSQMVTSPWNQVFSRWQAIIATGQQSGTTANRPATGLWIGRQFFDTTLGKPVYVLSVKPAVWVDGAGTVV